MDRSKPISKSRKGTTCPYSDSCFTCPLSDCRIPASSSRSVNMLPGDVGNRRLTNAKDSEEQFARRMRKRAKEVAERRVRHTTNNK